MLTLREKQSLFALLICQFVVWIYAQGYEITWGEILRTHAQAEQDAKTGAGISNSLHLLALAADLHLFKDGVYLTQTESYKVIGDYWKSLHPLCRWGGDFEHRKDGNHFSVEHNGVR